MAELEFRRRRGSDTWHFHRSCSAWPAEKFETEHERPTRGELCNQCLAKLAADEKDGNI